jgi:hypothetical protein
LQQQHQQQQQQAAAAAAPAAASFAAASFDISMRSGGCFFFLFAPGEYCVCTRFLPPKNEYCVSYACRGTRFFYFRFF